jgi:orotidine-5'-phosphate decarboxylase
MDARGRLVFALDVPRLEDARALAARLRGKVGVFKVGLELFLAEGPAVARAVREVAGDAGLFLDLKLHDVPETVGRAAAAVAQLAPDYLTVHAADGEELLRAAVSAVLARSPRTKILGITVLTSVARDAETARLVLTRAGYAAAAGCGGVVASGEEAQALKAAFPGLLVVTPGIRPAFAAVKADDQRRVVTPAGAISAGADLLVVGRPIRDAADPAGAAERVVAEISEALSRRGAAG